MSAAKLPYLIDEICAAVEIYFTGRAGGQYLRTAFILCDNYTELIAKLFLLSDDPKWSEEKACRGGSCCRRCIQLPGLQAVELLFAPAGRITSQLPTL